MKMNPTTGRGVKEGLFIHYIYNMIYPCAKINIGLYVTERRADGYHNLQTVFYPIPLTDSLSIEEGDKDDLLLSGIPVAGDLADNLVCRVLNLVRRHHRIPPLRIRLEKNIPSGAGLGGGSSDAAAMMNLLNDKYNLHFTDKEMEDMVSTLGADCAFFIKSRPTMAEGIGNIFSPVQLDLTGWKIVLVKPDDFVSTKEAYSMVKHAMPQHDLFEAIQRPVEEWKDLIFNDFENSVLPLHPNIARIKQRLYDLGAAYACMSGSGSSVFGLFRQIPEGIKEKFAPHFCHQSSL